MVVVPTAEALSLVVAAAGALGLWAGVGFRGDAGFRGANRRFDSKVSVGPVLPANSACPPAGSDAVTSDSVAVTSDVTSSTGSVSNISSVGTVSATGPAVSVSDVDVVNSVLFGSAARFSDCSACHIARWAASMALASTPSVARINRARPFGMSASAAPAAKRTRRESSPSIAARSRAYCGLLLWPIAFTALRRTFSLLSPSRPTMARIVSGASESRNASAALARTRSSSASRAVNITRSVPSTLALARRRSRAGVAAHSLARCSTASEPENSPDCRETMSPRRSAAQVPSRSTSPRRIPTA